MSTPGGPIWLTTAEARDELSMGASALYKRVQRYHAKHPDTPLIEREDAGADGGRPRYRLHRELVEMWRQEPTKGPGRAGPDGSVNPHDLLEQSARMAEITENHLELRNRDERIAHLEQQLTAANVEAAAQRDEANRWREMVHRLSAPRD